MPSNSVSPSSASQENMCSPSATAGQRKSACAESDACQRSSASLVMPGARRCVSACEGQDGED
eukprot:5571600-Prymnesium_polylepis.1